MKKKLLSVLLTLTMVSTLFSGLTIIASAGETRVTFSKTTSVVAGKEYIIVASGSSSALANNDSINWRTVTVAEDKISISEEEYQSADYVWTTSAATGNALTKGDFIFTNGGKSLYRLGTDNQVGFGTSTTEARYGMSYSNGTLANINSSNTPYYLQYNPDFNFNTRAPSAGSIVFYVKDEGEGGEEAEPDLVITPTTSNPTESYAIAANGTLTLGIKNESTRSDYDFTITLSKTGVATADKGKVTVLKGETGTEHSQVRQMVLLPLRSQMEILKVKGKRPLHLL